MARRFGPLLLATATGLGCVALPQIPSSALEAVRAASRSTSPAPSADRPAPARPPPPAGSAAPATPSLYAPGEAVSDALSGPLEIVGVGEWPGTFRRLACIYRNARVLVVDERCSDPAEPTGLLVHVLSPSRGRATIFVEAGAAISRARRPGYKSIGVASAAPRERSALDAAKSCEEVIASETDAPGKIRAMCSAGTQSPKGSCSKGAGTTAEAYAATVEPFLREPPTGWYDLVRSLVGLRAQAYAGIRPASLPLPRLAAWGASWARDREITVDETAMKRVGNPQGRSAAIALTGDGGVLVAGTTTFKGQTVPGVVRADARGMKVWFKALPEKGFDTHEVASVAALPDGALVLSPGYDEPGWKPKARVLRLDDKGNVRWQWIGRGKNHHQIPQIVTAQPTPKGTVLLRGYVQLVADGDVHEWNGELDARGKVLRDEVGPVLPDHGASFE